MQAIKVKDCSCCYSFPLGQLCRDQGSKLLNAANKAVTPQEGVLWQIWMRICQKTPSYGVTALFAALKSLLPCLLMTNTFGKNPQISCGLCTAYYCTNQPLSQGDKTCQVIQVVRLAVAIN